MKIKWMVVALAVAGGALVVGCAGQGVVSEASAAAPTTSAVPVALSPDDGFLDGLADETTFTWPATDAVKLRVGHAICQEAPWRTREQVIGELTAPPNPWGRGSAEIVVDRAKAHLCPAVAWGTVSLPTAAAQPSVPADPMWGTDGQSHFAIYSDGVYQVTKAGGSGSRVQPGTYHTEGGTGGMGCYWRKLNPETRETILGQSNYIHGPDTVILKEGDWFETAHCSSWGVQR